MPSNCSSSRDAGLAGRRARHACANAWPEALLQNCQREIERKREGEREREKQRERDREKGREREREHVSCFKNRALGN